MFSNFLCLRIKISSEDGKALGLFEQPAARRL